MTKAKRPIDLQTPRLVDDVPPNIVGSAGKAWKFDTAAAIKRLEAEGHILNPHVSICNWLVYAPFAHTVFSFYFITTITLGRVPWMPPAEILLPGATHEIMVYACNPDWDAAIDDIPMLLPPGNFFGQFIEPSDDAARVRVAKAVAEICNGKLNPDTDYAQQWIDRFSDSNLIREKQNDH